MRRAAPAAFRIHSTINVAALAGLTASGSQQTAPSASLRGFIALKLNQSAAMFRDDIKCLTRRTWRTTKRRDRLQRPLDMYVCAHNARIRPLQAGSALFRWEFLALTRGGAGM